MKRIFFITEKKINFIFRLFFIIRMRIHGVKVYYREPADSEKKSDGNLYAVDNIEAYIDVKEKYGIPLVLLSDVNRADLFPGAKFFTLDYERCEASYFQTIYNRINGLPCTILKTKHLILRETTEPDVDALCEIYRDPEMTRYTDKVYTDSNEERKYVKEYREKVYETTGIGIWTVVNRENMQVIGRAGLTMRGEDEGFELGYAIGTLFQGNGYATEAVNGILRFAGKKKVRKIFARVESKNAASKRVLEKAGFVFGKDEDISGKTFEIWVKE